MRNQELPTDSEVVIDAKRLLREHGIAPTAQRITIARLLIECREHLSAEDVFIRVNAHGTKLVSKATVYNTLSLFAERGLIREVVADPRRVYFDPNVAPHHHFFDVEAGKLIDIPVESVQIDRLPSLPNGMKLEGVDVILRIRLGKD